MASRVVSVARLPPLHGYLPVGPWLLRTVSVRRGGRMAHRRPRRRSAPCERAGVGRRVGRAERAAYLSALRPWLSAMAQGQCSSLLVRLSLETGCRGASGVREAGPRPLHLPSARGGVAATLAGGPFLEEYPTNPPSFVLNGAIFAAWGVRDVAVGLGDAEAESLFSAVGGDARRSGGALGHRLLVALRPLPASRPQCRQPLLPRAARAAARPARRDDRAVRARGNRGAFRVLRRRRRNRARALGEKVVFPALVPHGRRGAVRA